MALMGFRQYARHRAAAGLAGGTLAAVQTAIRSRRIVEALVVGAPGEPRKIDQAKADALWTARTDLALSVRHARVKPTAEQLATTTGQDGGEDLETASYAAARAARERANARKAQMEADVMQGRLVDAEAVAAAWEKIIGTSRTKVLSLPSKIRTRFPTLTAADVALIEALVRDTLDELAQGRIGLEEASDDHS